MRGDHKDDLTVVFLGTYDLSKPRVRLLIAGAKEVGLNVIECHADIWKNAEDKSQIKGFAQIFYCLLRLLTAYPPLIWRYLRLPTHDAVVIGYMGQLDVLLLWPFVRMRKVPLLWDTFISLYDTVVNDRKMVSKYSPLAWAIYALEWLSCRAATKIFLDTGTHARFIEQLYHLPVNSVGHVYVGAESIFYRQDNDSSGKLNDTFTVLFYGQFIPLHGIDVIIEAARYLELRREEVRWVIVGRGQESARIDRMIADKELRSVERIAWTAYEKLPELIAAADVCLGIFGTSAKSSHVVPNKVYQIVAANGRLVTADTPAMREVFTGGKHVLLITPGNPEKLAEAIISLKKEGRLIKAAQEQLKYGPREIGAQLKELLVDLVVRWSGGAGEIAPGRQEGRLP